jgi:nicotinamidase-related amidase
MLLSRSESCVFLVDVQEKLLPYCLQPEKLISHASWVLRLAQDCNVPILWSEHYPQGLGSTVASLKKILVAQQPVSKTTFSCCTELKIVNALQQLACTQVILLGIEAHVCVLQTALELKDMGYSVFVLREAISSRHDHDLQLALMRLQQTGIPIISSEMLFFEWMRDASNPLFKQLRATYLR